MPHAAHSYQKRARLGYAFLRVNFSNNFMQFAFIGAAFGWRLPPGNQWQTFRPMGAASKTGLHSQFRRGGNSASRNRLDRSGSIVLRARQD